MKTLCQTDALEKKKKKVCGSSQGQVDNKSVAARETASETERVYASVYAFFSFKIKVCPAPQMKVVCNFEEYANWVRVKIIQTAFQLFCSSDDHLHNQPERKGYIPWCMFKQKTILQWFAGIINAPTIYHEKENRVLKWHLCAQMKLP